MEGNVNELTLNMSPRALDELKMIGIFDSASKYEMPMLVFPNKKVFFAKIANDNGLIILNFNIGGCEFSLRGVLDKDNFSCRNVCCETLNTDKAVSLCFVHKNTEKNIIISENLRHRLEMWYEYIDSVLEQSRKNMTLFFCEEIIKKNGNTVYLKTSDIVGRKFKDLSVGFVDDKGNPVFSIGKAEDYDNNVLKVVLWRDNLDGIESGVRMVLYDAATEITCKRMKSGLDGLCAGEAINKRLPEFIFEPKNANKLPGDNIFLSAENLLMANMNPEQIEAVEGVMNSEDLYLIQGPPGTGKTTVIAEICYQNAVRKLKTLVVSQSNLAVDNAISRVMNHPEIRVLRKGDSTRVEAEGLPFIEDNVVHTWIENIAYYAEKNAYDINKRIALADESMRLLPELMDISVCIFQNRKQKSSLESQLHFYKSVIREAEEKRIDFFEMAAKAYENDDLSAAEKTIGFYPEDFIIPNGIYNLISERYIYMKADVENIREYEDELDFFNYFTEKLVKHLDYIEEAVGYFILDRTYYEGEFYYADRENTEELFLEGKKILAAEPSGINKILFGLKWKKIAAIYYRRVESLMTGIQVKTIRLCDKINRIRESDEYRMNAEGFHSALDALCENYDGQYYNMKGKLQKINEDCCCALRDYKYSVELLKEKISGNKFYEVALKNVKLDEISPEILEKRANERYNELRFRFDTWKRLLSEWRKIISERGANYGALKKLYIDNANVIGITCIQSGTRDFKENYPSFDVVIIDESSKSTLPDIIIPMLKGKKVVLVGDHKQLPPFIDMNAYDEIESDESGILKELMKKSLFEELYEKADKNAKTMLYRQYRMHKDIAGLVNQFYIDSDAGRLESPSEAEKNHMCHGDGISEDNHVIWYDIPNSEKFYEMQKNKSYYNVYEVMCIKNILGMLNRNLEKNGGSKGIGIITFYDAQVRLLENELIYSGFCQSIPCIHLRIGSVDRFQGMEEEIVIISFVRNNAERRIGFARDSRRINVAMSRAKELLVIVGCSDNFVMSFDSGASIMFKNIYKITDRLGGIKKASEIPEFAYNNDHIYTKEYIRDEKEVLEYDDEERSDNDSSGINILDYFILKAAIEFQGRRITAANISKVLGIAPVFINSRILYLNSEGCLEICKQNLEITEKGKLYLLKMPENGIKC